MKDNNLKYFKNLLLKNQLLILNSLHNLRGGDEEFIQNQADDLDYANTICDLSLKNSIGEKQKSELEDIKLALRKIENGEYGICEMCGEEINIARMKVKPHSRFCITCKEDIEKSKKLKATK